LVAAKSQRVLATKKKSKALTERMVPTPTQKTVERLMRRIWEFSEEIRARSIAEPSEAKE
jgi:hypothetical protein